MIPMRREVGGRQEDDWHYGGCSRGEVANIGLFKEPL